MNYFGITNSSYSTAFSKKKLEKAGKRRFPAYRQFSEENCREQEIIFPVNCSPTFAEYEELPLAIPKYNGSNLRKKKKIEVK